ncbi:MAG: aminotransferase class I/II-fold pyridoxal phosphate-dependent enzyme [Bacteroidota bacterium]|nr:aminotransferase class I/II-fold pyridoxal phosphate-dependent enzyme [Bacteroidota bacterium]
MNPSLKTNKEYNFDVSFLKECKKSSASAYENLSFLLEALENEFSRKQAGEFLFSLVDFFESSKSPESFQQNFHFSFSRIPLKTETNKVDELILLQLPSIFAPEEWSYTFYEGIARYSVSEFYDKTVSELGTGNGWISIAIAKRCLPKKIYGLDINPKAIMCAKLNTYLNGMNQQGEIIIDEEGKTLLDRIEFHTSDLLDYCLSNSIKLDHIVGCIPQVLNPDPDMPLNVLDNASDEFLHSLSNYCAQQGYVEDQFGLGLIAKALEQAVELITPSAKIIMNMGGRPGTAVLDRLFTRRGFEVKKVWHRKIIQASDTEIKPLVEIERQTKHRFEFFMGINSTEPISAKTAMVYAEKGGEIAHSLTVYEAKLRNHTIVKPIFNLLKNPVYNSAKSALDLAYTDNQIADEKTAFLGELSNQLIHSSYFPYQETDGDPTLKERISEFLNSYYFIPLSEKNFLISPNTTTFVKNIIDLYQPKLAIIDKDFSNGLPNEWLTSLPGENDSPSIIEAPSQVNLTINLMKKLKPEIVITRFAEFENKSPDTLIRLIEAAKETNTRVFIDISNYMDLSSSPENNAVFQYLAENKLPLHCAVIGGLVKNLVYQELQICFLLSENKDLIDSLTFTAEFNYSRTPLLTQWYYSQILFDLLRFHLPSTKISGQGEFRPLQKENEVFRKQFINEDSKSVKAFTHPAIVGNQFHITSDTVRLDYGENCLSTPDSFKVDLFEAFARQHFSIDEINPAQEIKALLFHRYSINPKIDAHLIYSSGVAPLFGAIAETCRNEGGTILFPYGTYGYFIATCMFYNTSYKIIETKEEDLFKISAKSLEAILRGTKNAWIFLNLPVVNPTGAQYSANEIDEILSVCRKHKVKPIIDTIFSGLEFDKNVIYPNLENYFKEEGSNEDILILGGISKEFAAGGIRFGYAYTRNDDLKQNIKSKLLSEPYDTVKYSCKKLYEKLAANDNTLMNELDFQRKLLKDRAETLTNVLNKTGWKTLPSQGGLFLVAKPEFYIGKSIKFKKDEVDKEIIISSESVSEALYYTTGLLINNSSWTEIPDYCRFVLSVEEKDFTNGINKLSDFYNLFK